MNNGITRLKKQRITNNDRLYAIRLSVQDTPEHEFVQKLVGEMMKKQKLTKAQAMRQIFLNWIHQHSGITPNATIERTTDTNQNNTLIQQMSDQIDQLWAIVNNLLNNPKAMAERVETMQQEHDTDGIDDSMLEALMGDFHRDN